MATSFGSAASFTFGNMKPASGEQIDSLWGQNIADNTGYLRSQWLPFLKTLGTDGTLFSGTNTGGNANNSLAYKIPIVRVKGHNRLVGTFRGDGTHGGVGSPDSYATHGIYFFGDLGTFGGTSAIATTNIGAAFNWGSTYSFELSLDSYLSIGSWGTLVAYYSGTLNDFANGNPATLQFNFSEMPKAYTTWAN